MNPIPIPEIVLLPVLPALLVTLTAFLVLLADLFAKGPDREGLGWIGIVGLLGTVVAGVTLWNTELSAFSGTLQLDRYALFFVFLLCTTSALTLLMSMNYLQTTDVRTGDYYTLLLFATVGMILMVAATDLMVLFLGLEIMSIAAYALTGIWRSQARSNEAALKYFLLGAFATGFLLFGIALLYGAAGSTLLADVAKAAAEGNELQRGLLLGGAALLTIGFAFKIAAVPFHVWAPDVYEGAPTSVTALMAVGVKTAAFAAFARIVLSTLAPLAADWSVILSVIAALSMTVGNVTALLQTSVKRMLAYSSVAHAGYLLVALVAGGPAGGSALLFYLAAYAAMSLGAFSVVIALGRRGEPNENLDDYAGLAGRSPLLAAAMTVFLLSLAGIPPFAGFVGKFYVFAAAVEAGHVGLVVIGVINSLVSVYYYIGVPVRMYMQEGGAEVLAPTSRPYLLASLLVALVATVGLGLLPSGLLDLARQSFLALG